MMRELRQSAAAVSIAGGLVGGLVGAGVMSASHTLTSKITGHPHQPAEEEDATVKVADAVSRAVHGRSREDDEIVGPLGNVDEPIAGFGMNMNFADRLAANLIFVNAEDQMPIHREAVVFLELLAVEVPVRVKPPRITGGQQQALRSV